MEAEMEEVERVVRRWIGAFEKENQRILHEVEVEDATWYATERGRFHAVPVAEFDDVPLERGLRGDLVSVELKAGFYGLAQIEWTRDGARFGTDFVSLLCIDGEWKVVCEVVKRY